MNVVTNYDGGIIANPRELAFPETVEELQSILKDTNRYPGPVRAVGSNHSLTPCAASDGTMVSMSRMTRVVSIDREAMTFTAQAGLQLIDASKALREHNLQFLTNVEIGNLTLGSAACCHTKDGLDGIEFGQVSSYVTGIKWVTPNGDLAEASADRDPELLRRVRSSHGLCGIVYEMTFRVKPMEAAQLRYLPLSVDSLTERRVSDIIDASEGLVCWTVGKTAIFQTKKRIARTGPLSTVMAEARHFMWNHGAAFLGRGIDVHAPESARDTLQDGWFALIRLLYSTLNVTGGLSIADADKIVNYRHTKPSSRYAFTFWAFPRAQWLTTLREYLAFTDAHFAKYGFRCNMPLGSYYVRKDSSSLLSYSEAGDMFSIDPIHAYTDRPAWDRFLHEFNDFAAARNGIPLLNQSPFITRAHVQAAYGARWQQFSDWVRSVDPNRRMVNPFFADLLA